MDIEQKETVEENNKEKDVEEQEIGARTRQDHTVYTNT